MLEAVHGAVEALAAMQARCGAKAAASLDAEALVKLDQRPSRRRLPSSSWPSASSVRAPAAARGHASPLRTSPRLCRGCP